MNIEHFLAHAIALEREAARRYEELAAAMQTEGNKELKAFFTRMAGYSRKHLAEAEAKSGFRPIPHLQPEDFEWPDGTAPETADWAGVDSLMGPRGALELALDCERRGHGYYAAVSASTQDQELRALAHEFAEEEADHIRQLEKLIEACPAD